MSLYTSNMSASEEATYRLRMYIDEDYNPQGDGGDLTFGVKVNVYGQVGNKETPMTTTTILAANSLQETKEHMFNYTNSGKQFDSTNKTETEADSNYITNGLYSAEDEDGTSYYFRGNVTNNNVQFGEYQDDYYLYQVGNSQVYYQSLKLCQKSYGSYAYMCDSTTKVKLASKGDKMYWKIVRINGDGSLRLIYNGTNPTATYDNNNLSTWPYISSYIAYEKNDNNQKYTGYTYDNGTNSFAKNVIDTWYKNALGNTTYDKKVESGRFCSDSSGYKKATDYGLTSENYYFSSMDRLNQTETGFTKDNAPTFKCPTTTETFGGSYRLKAGLITGDELSFGGDSTGVISNNFYVFTSPLNRLNVTMTPGVYITSGNHAMIWRGAYKGLDLMSTSNAASTIFRPVINVSRDAVFTSGDGSLENPYVLK